MEFAWLKRRKKFFCFKRIYFFAVRDEIFLLNDNFFALRDERKCFASNA